MANSDIGLIAQAIAKVSELWAEWLKSSDRRKLSACIDAGEKYIQTTEDTTLPEKKKKDLLRKYKYLFFKYN
ncbi:MAG: hypothetical protein FJ241_10985 [Nitrospira sp.]|nr:hypothetical protein [Nitrospira sp.]